MVRDAAKDVVDFLHSTDPVLVHTQRGHTSWVSSVAFLPDSEHVVSGGWDGTVRKWRMTDGCEVGKVKPTIRSDSQTLVSGSVNGSVTVWSVWTGKRVAGPPRLTCVAFSPAGDKIASNDGCIRVFDDSLKKEIIPAISVDPSIWSVVWSPDGSQLIGGDVKGNTHFFDSSNGTLLATCRGHTGAIPSITVSQGGKFLSASASWDCTVRLWNISTHRQLACLEHPGGLLAVSISPNGRYLASGGDNRQVHIWRLPDFDRTLQENNQGSTSSIIDPCATSQPSPLSSDDPDTNSPEDATAPQDRENDDDEQQGSGVPQGHHMTRTASGDSWLDMPATLPVTAQTVPAEDRTFTEFFGEDNPSTPQFVSGDDRPGKWKQKAKESRQHLFKQLKNFRNELLPLSSLQKLRVRISRIRRRSPLVPENVEFPIEERDCHQQGENEQLPPNVRSESSRTAYNRILRRIAVASNDPPVQQEKWYFAMRDGQLVRTTGPSAPHPSQQQSPQPGPSTSAVITSPETQGASPSMISPASAPASSTDVGCGCCGFSISVRRL